MKQIGKLLFPALLIILGLIAIIIGNNTDQNGLFLFGAFVTLIIGVTALLAILNVFNKTVRIILLVVFLAGSGLLAFYDVNSIQKPLEFEKTKEARYAAVVQRMKDIREAQKGYKSAKGNYAPTLDTLAMFILQDSMPIVKAIGDRPDTLTEAKALELGIMKRDTIQVWAKEKIFNSKYLATRNSQFALAVDSFEYIPFTKGEKFNMSVGEVEKNNVKVKTLYVSAPNAVIFPDYDKNFYVSLRDLEFGSTTDPVLNGNWE